MRPINARLLFHWVMSDALPLHAPHLTLCVAGCSGCLGLHRSSLGSRLLAFASHTFPISSLVGTFAMLPPSPSALHFPTLLVPLHLLLPLVEISVLPWQNESLLLMLLRLVSTNLFVHQSAIQFFPPAAPPTKRVCQVCPPNHQCTTQVLSQSYPLWAQEETVCYCLLPCSAYTPLNSLSYVG